MTITGAVFILTIYYTDSRGGFIALSVVLAFFAYKEWGLLKACIVAGGLFVVLLFGGIGRMSDLSPFGQSASGRAFAWIYGLTLLKAHPFFGVGFQQFVAHYGRAAHSSFIECMAELGIIGYFVWLALIYSSILSLIKAENGILETSKLQYVRFLQLSFIGFLTSSIFLSQAYSPVLYLLIGMSTALAKGISNHSKVSIVPSPREFIHIFIIFIGSIIFYKLFAIMYM
jgi:O-antigen ligase